MKKTPIKQQKLLGTKLKFPSFPSLPAVVRLFTSVPLVLSVLLPACLPVRCSVMSTRPPARRPTNLGPNSIEKKFT